MVEQEIFSQQRNLPASWRHRSLQKEAGRIPAQWTKKATLISKTECYLNWFLFKEKSRVEMAVPRGRRGFWKTHRIALFCVSPSALRGLPRHPSKSSSGLRCAHDRRRRSISSLLVSSSQLSQFSLGVFLNSQDPVKSQVCACAHMCVRVRGVSWPLRKWTDLFIN